MSTKKKIFKVLFAILGVVLGLAIIIGAIFGAVALKYNRNAKRFDVKTETFGTKGVDRIHFLNTGHSDAFLLESQGKFALVDAGEDTEFPASKPALDLKGYEEMVLAYLKEHASNEDGKVVLEFVLGTHAHSDHIGGFDTIIEDTNVIVKKAYLRTYEEKYVAEKEISDWDNKEVYTQMVMALDAKGVSIVSEIPKEPFEFGNFTCQFFNTERVNLEKRVGENDHSIGLKLIKGEKSAFLAADIDWSDGGEKRIAEAVGKVNLLKAGHHGYTGSSGYNFIKTLDPEIAIVSNLNRKRITPDVGLMLTFTANASVFVTGENDGVMATFTDNDIVLSNNLHSKKSA